MQNWNTLNGQPGILLVFAGIELDIVPRPSYQRLRHIWIVWSFQMEPGQSYRIYWTANTSPGSPIPGSECFLRILYGTIYNNQITQASAGFVGFADVLTQGLTEYETPYYADFVAPAGCKWASLCMYYNSSGPPQIGVYQIDCVSYGATSQWGADVTANSGNILLQNPNFAAGNTGWDLQTGWSIVSASGYGGSPYAAEFTGTTAAIINKQQPAIGAGANITASCWVNGSSNGTAAIRINFYSQGGTLLEKRCRTRPPR